jgi:phosphoribosylglycinamide formyltransferase 1
LPDKQHREPIVVLISGRGSNMRALVERSRDPAMGYTVAAVLSDQPAAAGLVVARELGVPARTLIPAPCSGRAGYDRELAAAIEEYAPSLIVLAGFMRILSAEFVGRYRGRILNIHPSLLPRFPGLDTHRRALEAREVQHGATVHFVTEQLDAGPAIIQARVDIAADDDEDSLARRVQAVEHRIYPLAVRWYCEGRLRCSEGRAWLDGAALPGPISYGSGEWPELPGGGPPEGQ